MTSDKGRAADNPRPSAPRNQPRSEPIRQLNDEFRSSFAGGRVMMTAGVAALEDRLRAEVLRQVRQFDRFTADNDPDGERHFGAVEQGGIRVFWKIDYYDATLTAGSENAADPAVTTRVMTIMLAEEY